MRVDFVVPRARKGKKEPSNLVACCTPCNTIKGTRVYANFEAAKAFVLKKREELRKNWESKTARPSRQVRKSIELGSSIHRRGLVKRTGICSLLGSRLLRPCTFLVRETCYEAFALLPRHSFAERNRMQGQKPLWSPGAWQEYFSAA